MKTSSFILFLAAALALGHRLNGAETGWLNLNNIIGGVVDAPVTRPDGSGAGAGVTAQLFQVNVNGSLRPLLPTTTFRTSPVAARFYVLGAAVSVLVVPFETVTLRMRAWEGKDWSTATLRGESKDFFITFGGQPAQQPPMYLAGLEGFKLEPTSVSVVLNAPQVNGDKFVFEVRATPGTRVVIQSSTNLKDWQTISAQTLADGLAQFSDVIGNEYQFYRALIE